MKEQVWFKARVISSHGRHSFRGKMKTAQCSKQPVRVKTVDLAVGDIVDCLQTSAEQVSIQKIRTAPLPALPQRRAENQTSCLQY